LFGDPTGSFQLQESTDTMPLNEEGLIDRVSIQHSVSPDAVRTILQALRAVAAWHSSAIQISAGCPNGHPVCQWMFNTSLKSKLDAVCTELAAYVAQTASADQGRSRD